MLATHNSVSGYPVAYPWYAKGLVNLWSKCQSLTLEDQWDLGVRYFDFRVRKGKSGFVIVCHGLANYDITFSQALLKILGCQTNCGRGELEPVYIRTIWDHTNTDGSDKEDVIENYKLMLEGFPSFKFTGLYDKEDDSLMYAGYHSRPSTKEYHASSFKWWNLLPPFIYSHFNNKKLHEEYKDFAESDSSYLMLDFIQKGLCTE